MAAPASPAVPTPRRRRTANTPTTYRTSAIRPLTTASECTNVTVGIARLSRPPPSSGSGRQVGAECAPPRSANAAVSPRAGAAASAGAIVGEAVPEQVSAAEGKGDEGQPTGRPVDPGDGVAQGEREQHEVAGLG